MVRERLGIADILHHHVGASVPGDLHDLVQPGVVRRRAGDEAGPQRVRGELLGVQLNSRRVVLDQSGDVAVVQRGAGRLAAAPLRSGVQGAARRLPPNVLARHRCSMIAPHRVQAVGFSVALVHHKAQVYPKALRKPAFCTDHCKIALLIPNPLNFANPLAYNPR